LETVEVLIVGGGPAGSTCAWQLTRRGIDCLVLDKAPFPRTKLCAGWITPEVVDDLKLADYPHGLLTFERIHVHAKGLGYALRGPQHSIRRYEFDAWLLERSGAPVHTHEVRRIRREPGWYIVDDTWRARYLIGAGGTRCPVYREIFRDVNPRVKELQAATLEHEFPFEWKEGDCHLWFFDKGLPGYSWYVPKSGGHLNLGIGAVAERLKPGGWNIKVHWEGFVDKLRRRGVINGVELKPRGYSYFLRGPVEVVRRDNAFITGDAAGLATRDMCEGIGPAVKSGMMAARAIAHGATYRLEGIDRHSLGNPLAARLLDHAFTKGKG
jgi:flavin-dependent dehydrogenase